MQRSIAREHIGAVVPAPVDLADRWLLRAAAHLAGACGIGESALPARADPAVRPLDVLVEPKTRPSADDAELAVLLAAAAVEARLNRTLRMRDPDDWQSIAHLSCPEKLALAPKLLREQEDEAVAAEHHELVEEASLLFVVRAGLLDDTEVTPPDAVRARTLVQTAARICACVSKLSVDDGDAAVAHFVERVTDLLAPRARALAGEPHEPRPDAWSWSRDVDFPPDLVGS
jgi:hypothetical protein